MKEETCRARGRSKPRRKLNSRLIKDRSIQHLLHGNGKVIQNCILGERNSIGNVHFDFLLRTVIFSRRSCMARASADRWTALFERHRRNQFLVLLNLTGTNPPVTSAILSYLVGHWNVCAAISELFISASNPSNCFSVTIGMIHRILRTDTTCSRAASDGFQRL